MLRALRSTTRDRLRPTVQQLIADVVSDAAGQPLAGPDHIAAAAEDLLSHIGGMAPHLGTGMAALTLSFDGYCTGCAAGASNSTCTPAAPASTTGANCPVRSSRTPSTRRWAPSPGPSSNMEHGHSGSAERGSNA